MSIPVHVGLVDGTGRIDQADLAEVVAALNEQVQSDVAPHWQHIKATVGAYTGERGVPDGTWHVGIEDQLDQPGALGYHADRHNQPYALIQYTDDWTVTASHELLEMLVDPWGNRMHKAALVAGIDPAHVGLPNRLALVLPSATDLRTRVEYLVEACDPCEAYSYEVGGVRVSDFLLPAWYRTEPRAGLPGSHLGLPPRTVQEGGYVSFAVGSRWWQVFNQGSLQLVDLGTFDRARFASLREFADHHARTFLDSLSAGA